MKRPALLPTLSVATGLAVAGGLAIWAAEPLTTPEPVAGACLRHGTATIVRSDLVSQIILDATLGYTGAYTIGYPAAIAAASRPSQPAPPQVLTRHPPRGDLLPPRASRPAPAARRLRPCRPRLRTFRWRRPPLPRRPRRRCRPAGATSHPPAPPVPANRHAPAAKHRLPVVDIRRRVPTPPQPDVSVHRRVVARRRRTSPPCRRSARSSPRATRYSPSTEHPLSSCTAPSRRGEPWPTGPRAPTWPSSTPTWSPSATPPPPSSTRPATPTAPPPPPR